MRPPFSRRLRWQMAFAILPLFLFGPTAKLASGQSHEEDARVRALDFLDQGVAAFKKGLFDQAIEDFKEAKQLDPSLLNASLYLATAYANLFIPGAPSKDNADYGKHAIENFQEVLARDPSNLQAIDGISSILYSLAGTPFDPKVMTEAKNYRQKHIDIKPKDPEPYYWIGVIDWSLAYRASHELRENWAKKTGVNLHDEHEIPEQVRQEFSNQYESIINEGIQHFKQAMALRPEYDDAMAYLNLLYRMKAQTEPTVGLRDADLRMADELVDEVKKIKEKKMALPEPRN